MLLIRMLTLFAALTFTLAAQAEKITIAAASDLKFAMDEIVAVFSQGHPESQVDVVYGSSGKFHAQIQNGAPYDLYFSADIKYAKSLVKAGFAAGDVKAYAFGRIVLWSSTLDASTMTLASLADTNITRIAIANPKHAPYGKRAEEALRAINLWDRVKSKLIFGENIAHTAQFVDTGNAQVGVIALALALSPQLANKGGYWLIPSDLHEPLEQGFIITRRAANNALAKQFADYMDSPSARAVMTSYGFVVPGETDTKQERQ